MTQLERFPRVAQDSTVQNSQWWIQEAVQWVKDRTRRYDCCDSSPTWIASYLKFRVHYIQKMPLQFHIPLHP